MYSTTKHLDRSRLSCFQLQTTIRLHILPHTLKVLVDFCRLFCWRQWLIRVGEGQSITTSYICQKKSLSVPEMLLNNN